MTQALNLALLANNVNTSGQLNGATGIYGTIPVSNLPTVTPAYGGTGLTSTPTNGQVAIGNGTGFTLTTLTAGSGIAITNSAGGISIATSGGGGLPGVLGQVFTTTGSGQTFTIPSGVTALKVTVVAGGGGSRSQSQISGGGGGGGAAISYLTGLTPGNTLSVTVGAGGSGANPATSGGTSSVSSGTQTISTISATGGSPNNSSPSGNVGGGAGSGGSLNISGHNGTSSFAYGCAGVVITGLGGVSIFGGGYGCGAIGNSNSAGQQGVVIFEW